MLRRRSGSQFDPEGNLVGHRGGPGEGYEWPVSNHGITIDYKGNVWSAATAHRDSQVLVHEAGQVPLQVGKAGARKGAEQRRDSRRTSRQQRSGVVRPRREIFGPAAMRRTLRRRLLEQRVAIIDADTGKLKRAKGRIARPDDTNLGPYKPEAPPAQRFRVPCTARISRGRPGLRVRL
jgi:hypothetical protein